MKKPYWNKTLILASMAFVVTLAPLGTARAELVSEEVQEDAISPEQSSDAADQDLVIIKKKRTALPAARKVVRRQAVQPDTETVALQEPAIEVQTATRAQVAMPQAAAQPEKKSVGSTVDSTIQSKMDGVREQFEQALVRQLDKIKITVADNDAAPAQQNNAVQTTVVTDSVINAHAAPEKAGYMSIDSAPVIADDSAPAEVSVAKKEEESKSSGIRISPIIGMTNLGSDYYKIDSRYTAGIELEALLDENLSAVIGYSYSQYDIGLAATNPLYVAQPYGYGNNGFGTLAYNQNVFEGALRVYLTPVDSKFRAFIGGGLGYNMGYLNYSTRYTQNYMYGNPYANSPDYEVKSWLGILQAGAEFQVSKKVSVGGLFKYDQVLSANENQPLNNYGFINPGYSGYQIGDKAIVGGSLAKQSFYSILGTVKVAF